MWQALFDAAVFCVTQGFSSEEVYGMVPEVFGKVYQSLKREEARKNVTDLLLMNQACNGDMESITSFQQSLSVWLPEQETGKNSKLSEFRSMLQGKNKLKKG